MRGGEGMELARLGFRLSESEGQTDRAVQERDLKLAGGGDLLSSVWRWPF
jgi:hypothetical protein